MRTTYISDAGCTFDRVVSVDSFLSSLLVSFSFLNGDLNCRERDARCKEEKNLTIYCMKERGEKKNKLSLSTAVLM